MGKPAATIGHVDADCFYASAHRVKHGNLIGIPVGVLGNQGACVIARSYEMKATGVTVGQPIWEAVRLCPDGVYIKRDFSWYEVLSRAMLDVVRSESPTVEYYSIDEFFFDADRIDPLALKERLLRETGLPVTIGVSRSRTLAKLASDAGKPNGCRVLLDAADIEQYLEAMPIQEVTGIAARSAAKLLRHGITTCGEFRRASPKLVNRVLTKTGEGLWWELHGHPIAKINTTRPPHKNMGRGGSIGKATADREIQLAWLVRNLERLIEALFWHLYLANGLSLFMAYKEGMGCNQRVSLTEASCAFEVLYPAARFMFDRAPPGVVTHIDLLADGLSYKGEQQLSLFATKPRVDELKRAVNDKLGRFVLRSGLTLPLVEIYADAAHQSEVCDIFEKSCF